MNALSGVPTSDGPRRRPRTIVIDGPGASGKSVVGRRLAAALGYLYFDTGALYRALTVLAIETGVAAQDALSLVELATRHQIRVLARPEEEPGYIVRIDERDITGRLHAPAVDAMVSPLSAQPEVRRLLLGEQRRIAAGQPVVMTGRDIGTVVVPDADLKLYLDASPPVRARRRLRERLARGERTTYGAELAALRSRDDADSGRAAAPLATAKDAVIVETDRCSVDEVVAHLLGMVARWPDTLTTQGGAAPCASCG